MLTSSDEKYVDFELKSGSIARGFNFHVKLMATIRNMKECNNETITLLSHAKKDLFVFIGVGFCS